MAFTHSDYERRGDAEWLDACETGSPEAAKSAHEAGFACRSALEAKIGRAFHMRALKEIAHVSQNYPELPLVLTENRISIPCMFPDGFAMSIQTDRGRYVVRLGEWRDEFALAGEAIELVEWALRGEIRLRIDIGARGRKCTAERKLLSGEWVRLPSHEDELDDPLLVGPIRTIYLRNGQVLT
jgi:hypothetical protein